MVSQLDPFLSVAANWFDEAFLDGLAAPKIPAPLLDDGKWTKLKPIIAPSDNAGPLTPPTLPASPLGGPPVEVERPRAVVAVASSQSSPGGATTAACRTFSQMQQGGVRDSRRRQSLMR